MCTEVQPSNHDFARGWLRRFRVRQVITALAVVVLVWLSSPIWLRLFPATTVYFWKVREARGVIDKIENFRRTTGSLPPDLCTFGLRCDEAAPLYYDVRKDQYVLWFSAPIYGFFTSLIYESGSMTWHEGE